MIADHLTCAIEDIDTQVANINAAIDAMRDQVDVLIDTRIQLLGLRDRVGGTIPLASSPVPVATTEQITALASTQSAAPQPPAPPVAVRRTRETRTTGASKSKYDLDEIAQVAREAIASGRSAVDALIDHTECPTPQMARYLMTSARAAGHDIPRIRSGRRPPALAPMRPERLSSPAPAPAGAEAQVTGKVFSCTDCDEEFTQVVQIARHCRLNHGRDAASIERTPTAPAGH